MKVTVAIITRNRSQLLKKCLTSLTKQLVKPYEVIVVDNASDDNTKIVIEKFKKELRIRYILEKKIGIPYARNRALEIARGDILAFIDDDVTVPLYWVLQIINLHRKYTALVIQGNIINMPSHTIYAQIKNYYQASWFKKYSDIPAKEYKLAMKGKGKNGYRMRKICTRNCSFKLKRLRKINLKFNTHILLGSDEDLGNRLLIKKEMIIFSPALISFHWEEKGMYKKLMNDFRRGRRRYILDKRWEKMMTVKVDDLAINFFSFSKIIQQNSSHNIQLLFQYSLIFYIHRLLYTSGYFFERYKGIFTSKSLNYLWK